MSTTVDEVVGPGKDRHPPGLYALFTTEMWERFSYYGMRALLVLYLTKAIGVARSDALGIYAVYTGLVFLTPLIGGRLSDRYLGQRKAVFIGGILMALGQFALTQREFLNLGLGLLIVGNGFFKPNISTMVGGLYPQGDHRRDGAYTIFYMGINLGAFLSPLVCGPLGENHGWWPGFATAGLGMTLGLLTFIFTQRMIQGIGLPPGRVVSDRAVLSARDWVDIVAMAALGFVGVYLAILAWPYLRPYWSPSILHDPAVMYHVLLVFYQGFILVGGLVALLYATEPRKKASGEHGAEGDAMPHEPLTREEWHRLGVIVIISLFSVVFWAGFEQSGGTLNLFADEKTDRHILGWEMPASILQAVNPAFIILLAPVFAILWTALAKRQFPLPSVAKQGLGLVLLGVAFAVMYFADELEKPTPDFPTKFAAAAKAVSGPAAEVKLIPTQAGDVTPTVDKTMAEASAQWSKGNIPYRQLEESARALKKAGLEKPAATVSAAFDEAARSRVSVLWLIAVYFVFTVAELFISPIGLSLVNKLAPARLASLMMATWFLCTAAANYLAGMMEQLIAPYHMNLWAFLGCLAAIPGLLMLTLTPVLVKMSHGRV
jgi:POT family proton-dependent oligopeptide transporter